MIKKENVAFYTLPLCDLIVRDSDEYSSDLVYIKEFVRVAVIIVTKICVI
jgi:hypothetical protein